MLELEMPKSRGCTWKKSVKSFLHSCFPINFSTILDSWLSVALSREAKSKNYRSFGSVERRNATQNFSHENLSGNRGFGSVYKGQIGEGTVIAVKVLDTQRTACWKSFATECGALRNLRHRNLVQLITSCSSIDFKNQEFLALVCEYLGNGSLEDWVRGKRRKQMEVL